MSIKLSLTTNKVGGSKGLQTYLEKDGRALASDFSLSLSDPKNWAKEFDHDRKITFTDKGRQTYHFVISPDPKDNATLEQVRDLATYWAANNFPLCKYAIYYHDDNGIIHAHVAMNAVQLDGYKIKISNADWRKLLNSANYIAKEIVFIEG